MADYDVALDRNIYQPLVASMCISKGELVEL